MSTDRKPRSSRTATATRNYRLFVIDEGNRDLNLSRRKKLRNSMRKYGYLKSYPVVCRRDDNGRLIVEDGQHRLAIAEELGLPVWYVVEEVQFDIAEVNSCAKSWSLADYANKFAKHGNESYQQAIQFHQKNNIPLSTSFALLAGTTNTGNIHSAIREGKFTVKDRTYAESVAWIYCAMRELSDSVKSLRFIEACMAACRVDGFNINRLLKNAGRCRDKLASYSTRDAYLEMLEEIYNFGQQSLVPLRFAAIQAMKDRNAINRNGKKKKGAEATA